MVLALSACGTLSTWDVTPAHLAQNHLELPQDVDDIVGTLVRDGQAPGMIVGILLPDGSTRFYGYGVTRQGGAVPGPDTLFAVGSLSKGFLGGMAATLVQEGRLSWSDTLPDLLPPDIPLSSDGARISVEQLATHTSGLPRQPITPTTLAYFLEYLFTGESFYRHFDSKTVLDYLGEFSAPSSREPRYSNIGYGLLGYVLERRTGLSLDALLAERITGPLGLAHTGYVPEALPGYSERARGHAGDQPKFIRRGESVPDWTFTDIMRGSAALHSTARDLLTYAKAHVNPDGSSLSAALADTMRVRYPRPFEAAGIAWIVDEVGDITIRYQIGIVAGYSSYLGINTANGTAVVILQNAFNWDCSAGHTLLVRLGKSKT